MSKEIEELRAEIAALKDLVESARRDMSYHFQVLHGEHRHSDNYPHNLRRLGTRICNLENRPPSVAPEVVRQIRDAIEDF